MLFHANRAHDCPLKNSFNRLMKKYRLSEVPKRLSGGGSSDDFSESTDETLSSSEEYLRTGSSEMLNPCETTCMNELRKYCVEQRIEMSEPRLFRFANFHRFHLDKVKDALDENRDNAFMDLQMRSDMKGQFVTKLLFPLSGLRTKKNNSQVIYSNPSRCNKEKDDMTKVLESLCYVMNDFSQTEQQCRDGIALVSNLEDFKMEHFDPQEWHQFLLALQGTLVPTKVTTVLLVNPPSWFKQDVYKKMRSSMPAHFRRNVHIITSDKLEDYLMEDYRAYLPTEMGQGYRLADEIIEDYVDLKAFEDKQKRHLIV
eukprot:CAMPEP_0113603386 /NCGR_PEP_ID=MMETSP0017_2-20120614/1250_1 /TAXON_ID=2856 /ORGANISM="Cylindrotheca closterium" /LENGTH=312 /DNA_ID=CAMNT_0000511773 /DNA_START=176 /DNA_END=1114 /DNA_ORIENTATION=- /assembly_acc=CAM_ASM_000147